MHSVKKLLFDPADDHVYFCDRNDLIKRMQHEECAVRKCDKIIAYEFDDVIIYECEPLEGEGEPTFFLNHKDSFRNKH